MLIVNYYSRFIEIAQLKRTTAEEVIVHTKSIFARHGVPEIMVSNNGPQYSSEAYVKFAQEFQFEHITSSPHYPQSNGESERAVKTVKSLLKKEGDPYLALMSYRATYSTTEWIQSFRTLNVKETPYYSSYDPRVTQTSSPRLRIPERDERIKTRQQRNFDHHHGVRELTPLIPGQTVWMPDREQEAQVTQEVGTRSYEVQTSEGTYRRNRKALVQIPELPNQTESNDTVVDTNTNLSEPPIHRSG